MGLFVSGVVGGGLCRAELGGGWGCKEVERGSEVGRALWGSQGSMAASWVHMHEGILGDKKVVFIQGNQSTTWL